MKYSSKTNALRAILRFEHVNRLSIRTGLLSVHGKFSKLVLAGAGHQERFFRAVKLMNKREENK